MYRLLAIAGENRERRRQRTHPARKTPELIARRPNAVWSWDITKLQGPERGIYYELFMVIDIFSRYVVGWMVSPAETGEVAEAFIADTLARHSIEAESPDPEARGTARCGAVCPYEPHCRAHRRGSQARERGQGLARRRPCHPASCTAGGGGDPGPDRRVLHRRPGHACNSGVRRRTPRRGGRRGQGLLVRPDRRAV